VFCPKIHAHLTHGRTYKNHSTTAIIPLQHAEFQRTPFFREKITYVGVSNIRNSQRNNVSLPIEKNVQKLKRLEMKKQ
jgi:hypothetical protein